MVNDRLQPRSDWCSAGRLAILSSVLFLSGIGSLIFETLWLRLSGLTFGNSIWFAALILSSFMAGMALGNAFAASSCVQPCRPLRLYAFLELVIASLGCTIVFGRPFLGEGLRPLFQALWNYQSFRRTVLLPALNQWIFDVDHASPQSALHEGVCLFRWHCIRSQKMRC